MSAREGTRERRRRRGEEGEATGRELQMAMGRGRAIGRHRIPSKRECGARSGAGRYGGCVANEGGGGGDGGDGGERGLQAQGERRGQGRGCDGGAGIVLS
ncbi:hypothetical protein KC19_3G195500 [Ceratodon purpureus]|uniref:Uncharacterized protein n=1 Tax=Ceratodon purpureus TaxID=3225 RepID=A0A8T0IKD3_CERPU|nr:hypothetical protein KC19_3G195500 [Ceratodon purpureus]